MIFLINILTIIYFVLLFCINTQKGVIMAKDLENIMDGNNVFLSTEINQASTNGVIVQLTKWVNALPIIKPSENSGWKIYTPYETIPNDIPVLNIWINCCGGKTNLRHSLSTLLNIASARGTIVKTYNLRQASSSASMIAISGTHGYRYMAQNAFNYIHFGNKSSEVSHQDEIEYATRDLKNFGQESLDLYLNRTKLTRKELNKYFTTEGSGYLTAEQCLDKGLCDWVITNDGRFVNSVLELKNQKQQ